MEFKVGSLMNLISGKSQTKDTRSQPGEEKIVYQQKPKVALAKSKKDKSANDKKSLKQRNDPKSRKPQSETKSAKPRTANFKQKFQQAIKRQSLKNVRTHASKPEVVENTTKSVVGKSFKYTSTETNTRTEDTTDGPSNKKQENLEKLERTIFVGNLPLTHISGKAISKLFSKFGEIESFRLRSVPIKDLRVPKKVTGITKDFHPDRTSTNAYVVMASKEAAEAALALDATVVDDHHLRVDKAGGSEDKDPRKAIFVGNLSFKAEEDDLWKLFEQCGEIDNVRILRDTATSVAKGVAYVNFKSADAVELALRMSETAEIHGRALKIRRSLPGKQTSNKATARKPGLRNIGEANSDREKKLETKEEKRFQKKMKRREKREAMNAKNEALGQRSRPFKDPATNESAAKSFTGIKAQNQQQKKKKKRFNKGEVQRKKLAKILANPKIERKNGESTGVAEMDSQPEPSTSSEAVAPAVKKSTTVKASSTSNNDEAPTSKKMKNKLSKVTKKAKSKTIMVEEKGKLKKKKLKKQNGKQEKKVEGTSEPRKKKAKMSQER